MKKISLSLVVFFILFEGFSQNVGIGTTTPAFKLDVRSGSINTDSLYRIGTSPVLSIIGNGNLFAGKNAGGNATAGIFNTAAGDSALFSNTTGYENVATGSQALFSNTTGYSNVTDGTFALYKNTIGFQNVATGDRALLYNTTGYDNVAIGYSSLNRNTTGNLNVAIGSAALFSNTTGTQNVATGYQALFLNSTGAANVANGYRALNSNSTGNFNVANGFNALYSNYSGFANVANGASALYANGGNYNVAEGPSALQSNTTGSSNIGIGWASDVLSGNLSYAIAIGAVSKVGCSNCFALGGTGIYHTNVGINNPLPVTDLHIIQQSDAGGDKIRGIRLQRSVNTNHWRTLIDPSNNYVFEYNDMLYTYINPTTGAYINPSDVRLKKDITPLESILDKVMALTPKKFHYKTNSADDPLLWGFIAQDVQKIFPEFVDVKDDGYLGISYTNFSVLAIKSIQEQEQKIEKLEKQNELLQKDLYELKINKQKENEEIIKRLELLENKN